MSMFDGATVTHRVLSWEDEKVTKAVINRCYGGFGLSPQAFEMLLDRKGIEYEKTSSRQCRDEDCDYYRKGHVGENEHYLWYYQFSDDRSDADLIAVVEHFGKDANGWASDLRIVEIPDDVEWYVEEYDGMEHVAEVHRTWT